MSNWDSDVSLELKKPANMCMLLVHTYIWITVKDLSFKIKRYFLSKMMAIQCLSHYYNYNIALSGLELHSAKTTRDIQDFQWKFSKKVVFFKQVNKITRNFTSASNNLCTGIEPCWRKFSSFGG